MEKKKNLIIAVSLFLVACLTVEVILLMNQNRELRALLNPPAPPELKPGDKIDLVRAQTLDGSSIDVSYSDNRKMNLIFVFSPTCPHCEKTLPVWNHLANAFDKQSVAVLGISTHPVTETKKYVLENSIAFSVVSVKNDTTFQEKYKITGVPETILLDEKGAVIKTWVGELQSAQIEEIRAALKQGKS